MVPKPLLSFLLALLLACFCSYAQQPMNFSSLTTKDGLSSNTVNAILKDRYGLMWFATEDGLNKFDGTNFTVYRYAPGNLRSLQSNEILSLYEDPKGNLWVGTSGGYLSMYDRGKDAFIYYGSPSMSNNVIRGICSDVDGNIWVAHLQGISIINPKTQATGTFSPPASPGFAKVCNCLFKDSHDRIWIGTNEGLFMYDQRNKTFIQYQHSDHDPASICNNSVSSITADKNNNIWIGTDEGLSMLKYGSTGFINFYAGENNPNTISNNRINTVIDGGDDKIWAGTANGLSIVDIKTNTITQIKFDAHKENWLNGKNITCVYTDNQGIFWMGAFRGGINRYTKNLSLINHIKSNPFDASGLPSPLVTSFAALDAGNIFVGTDGGGLSLFDTRLGTFKHIKLLTRLSKAEKKLVILSLLITKNNQLLAGTYADGLFIINPVTGSYTQMTKGNGLADLNANEIFCITEDRNGNRWVGTNGGGINILNPENKVIARLVPVPQMPNDSKLNGNPFIRDIKQDKKGNMWIATHGGGVLLFDSTQKGTTVFVPENSNLPNGKVTSILVDRNDNIWTGTLGGGLGLFDRGTKKFTIISELDGLQNNTVCEILQDDRGQLWLSTNKGIGMYNPATKKFTNFTYHNGVQRSNFITGAGLKSPGGYMFFGGQEGFNYFNPEQLQKKHTALTVIITDIKISNKSVQPSEDGPIRENISIAKRIDLNYKQNFALSFVGINYITPEQNVYAYKLAGFDRDWNYTGSSNTASYTNLDPGEYTFSVKSCNGDDVWDGPVTSVKIYVHPPFWRTIWAYIIYALVITGTLLFIRYRSIKKIQEKYLAEQEKMQAAHQRKEAERLHELDQLKLKFLTNLSHEFRTPISLILGPVDSLLIKQQAEQEATQLNIIKRNAKRLLNLVNQLLDFRKMEEQELKLHLKEGNLISFVKEVADSFLDLSERKKIGFTFSSDTDTFNTAFDHDKIERIIFNILSNAFKFTPEGGKITFSLLKENVPAENGESWLRLEFRDTGIGIPEDKKEIIFERFFQNPASGSILNQGTGIGLSITREFVKMQGGSIEVDSEINKGSCFTVRLPFTEIKKQPEEAAAAAPAEVKQEPPVFYPHISEAATAAASKNINVPLILLVEDNEDLRFYLKENLRLQYKVMEAANGQEGWQRALAAHPKLIVSDISMPGMDGIELCKKIKADKRTSHIPVILLTALSGEQAQISGLQTGANDYITKPFNFEILNAKIRNLLALNDKLKTTYSKQIDITSPVVEVSSAADKLLQNIALYIEENITDPQLSVENLSRHVGMSRSTLYSKLLELTGQTPVEFIRSVKLNKAAQLLEKTDMTVAEIAYTVGFSTPNYFTKAFKTKFNMLPSDYIATMRKQPGS